jgi:hypothetical protein
MSQKSVFKKSTKSTYMSDLRAIATAHIDFRKVAGTKEQGTVRAEGFRGHLSGKHNMYWADEQAWTHTLDYLDRHNLLNAAKVRARLIADPARAQVNELDERVAILEAALRIKRS